MPSIRAIKLRLLDLVFGTPFERAVATARRKGRTGFLFFWNRGLGDVALCLVPLFAHIRHQIPGARIAVITREDLKPAMKLTDADSVFVLPGLVRDTKIDVWKVCGLLGIDAEAFGTVFENPDPNRWLEGRRRDFPPVLKWNADWDDHARRLLPGCDGKIVIGVHVNSETAQYYGYLKDWPASMWQQLFDRFAAEPGIAWVLFGHSKEPAFRGGNITDLRGQTEFADLLSIARNRCRILVAPDSGVLTLTYYLDAVHPLDVISLWSDPRQGILRQGCASPNPQLHHVPLFGTGEDVRNIAVDAVAAEVRRAIDRARSASEKVATPAQA